MINVGVDAVGLRKFEQKATNRLNFLSQGGMRTVLQPAALELVEDYKKNIESFTPGNVPDLAESTKKAKMRKVGFIYPILVASRQFIQSIYARVQAPSGSGWIIKIGFRGSHGNITNAELADIHIFGRGRVPARDFTTPSKQWKQNLFRRLRDALRRL